jgi:hypothetical protein
MFSHTHSEGRGVATQVDDWLMGNTRLPAAGGIKQRVSFVVPYFYVPPEVANGGPKMDSILSHRQVDQMPVLVLFLFRHEFFRARFPVLTTCMNVRLFSRTTVCHTFYYLASPSLYAISQKPEFHFLLYPLILWPERSNSGRKGPWTSD